jgi:hypothetical protein
MAGLMALADAGLLPLEPAGTVWAHFAQHSTGATSVALPAAGGTVVVDLVISANVPVLGFSARPALQGTGTLPASEVVRIDASGWTPTANARVSLGAPGASLPSYYHFGLLDWLVAMPGLDALDQQPRPPHSGLVTGRSLNQLALGEVLAMVERLDAVHGALSVPASEAFTTAAPLGGCLRNSLSAGPAPVATLTLQVAAAPGTYTLNVVEGTCTTPDAENQAMTAGVPFTIIVQDP